MNAVQRIHTRRLRVERQRAVGRTTIRALPAAAVLLGALACSSSGRPRLAHEVAKLHDGGHGSGFGSDCNGLARAAGRGYRPRLPSASARSASKSSRSLGRPAAALARMRSSKAMSLKETPNASTGMAASAMSP